MDLWKPCGDLLVVGAGPAGLAAAIAAVRSGLDHEVVEKGVLVDVHLPLPARHVVLHHAGAARARRAAVRVAVPQADARGGARLLPARRRHVPHPRLARRAGGGDRAAGPRVPGAHDAGPSGAAPVEAARCARHVIVATGYYDNPKRIGVPGEDLPHVSHYFDEPHPYHGRQVVIVGGSNSAAEAALVLFRAGAHVTLVHRRAELSASIKYWVRPDIENRIAERSVAARFESRVVEIGPDAVRVSGPRGEEAIPASAVFLLTGYLPDVVAPRGGGRARRPGDPAPRARPATFETNVPRLYLAGAIVAGADSHKVFIENGRFHGAAIVKSILEKAAARA